MKRGLFLRLGIRGLSPMEASVGLSHIPREQNCLRAHLSSHTAVTCSTPPRLDLLEGKKRVAGIGITLLKVSDELPRHCCGSRVCCCCCWPSRCGRLLGSRPWISLPGPLPHHWPDSTTSSIMIIICYPAGRMLSFTSFVSTLLAACGPSQPR